MRNITGPGIRYPRGLNSTLFMVEAGDDIRLPLARHRLPAGIRGSSPGAVKSTGRRLECGRFDRDAIFRIPVTSVPRSLSEWIDFLYGPIFRVIGFFYRIYSANRARVDRLRENARVAGLLRALAVIVLIGWILVWYLAPDERRHRLTEEIKQTLGMEQPSAGN